MSRRERTARRALTVLETLAVLVLAVLIAMALPGPSVWDMLP